MMTDLCNDAPAKILKTEKGVLLPSFIRKVLTLAPASGIVIYLHFTPTPSLIVLLHTTLSSP
jgi:hypothetical protein